MDRPTLPQNDPHHGRRTEQLEAARVAWKKGLWRGLNIFIETTPAREMPSLSWILKTVPALVRVWLNDKFVQLLRLVRILNWRRYRTKDHTKAEGNKVNLRGVEEAPDSAVKKGHIDRISRATKLTSTNVIARSLNRTLGNYGSASNPSGEGSNQTLRNHQPEKYREVFKLLPFPEIVKSWPKGGVLSDEEFAWQRLAGPNPEILVRVDGSTHPELDHHDELYMVSYLPLTDLQDSGWYGLHRWVPVPVAYFAPTGDTQLPIKPVGIWVDGIWVFPDSPFWDGAKYLVQVADMNHHELVSHLAETHLLVELFLLASRHNLAESHPILRLLVHHFEGTLFINDQARNSLIAPGGAIDRLFGGTIDSSQEVAVKALANVDFSRLDLPTRTRKRDIRFQYPWLEDALDIWSILESFVYEYVHSTYSTHKDFINDHEMAAWIKALSKPLTEGGAPGFRAPRSRDELVKVLTTLIFQAGPHHAAVNFPQFPAEGFTPMFAGSAWGKLEDSEEGVGALMPPRQLALQLADTLYLLSAVNHTQLGDYELGALDPKTHEAVRRFQKRLSMAESVIEKRNKKRWKKYTHLMPSVIPQSINI